MCSRSSFKIAVTLVREVPRVAIYACVSLCLPPAATAGIGSLVVQRASCSRWLVLRRPLQVTIDLDILIPSPQQHARPHLPQPTYPRALLRVGEPYDIASTSRSQPAYRIEHFHRNWVRSVKWPLPSGSAPRSVMKLTKLGEKTGADPSGPAWPRRQLTDNPHDRRTNRLQRIFMTRLHGQHTSRDKLQKQ